VGDTSFQNNINATIVGGAIPTLSQKQVSNYPICMPPNRTEQTAIATILSDMDAEIDALTAKMTKARNIKQGMMQELLTGRIRLVSEEAENNTAKRQPAYQNHLCGRRAERQPNSQEILVSSKQNPPPKEDANDAQN
jgi:restriction endonuclease S subunit